MGSRQSVSVEGLDGTVTPCRRRVRFTKEDEPGEDVLKCRRPRYES